MAGAVDEDTRRTIADGRRTLGAVLSTAQRHLQKVFIVFVIGFIGTFYVLRLFVWEQLKADLFGRLDPAIVEDNLVIATTPFDVILLQVKIGLVIGALIALPVLLYYSRDALHSRGLWPQLSVLKALLAGIASAILFAGGVLYSYEVFFPLLFEFLVSNAVQTGIRPTYSIVKWAQFVFILSLTMGLAAQLPLVMPTLAYTEVVPYRLFREKWKHAVLGMVIFGAMMNGSPDPFSMSLVAAPMIVLYGAGLAMTKATVAIKYGSQQIDPSGTVRSAWKRLLTVALLTAAVVVGVLYASAEGLFAGPIPVPGTSYVVQVPTIPLIPTLQRVSGAPFEAIAAVIVLVAAFGVFALAALYTLYASIDYSAIGEGSLGTGRGRMGDPSAIDVSGLDVAGVRAAPAEVFLDMSEEEALTEARAAMEAGDPEKAQAILDRFDEAHADDADEPDPEPEPWPGRWESAAGKSDAVPEPESADPYGDMDADVGADAGAGSGTDAETGQEGEGSNPFSRTAAGMVDAFTEEETTEEDIGGYYYDIAFVLSSLRSKTFRLVALFMTVLGGVFYFLYQGGVREIQRDFLSRLPANVKPTNVDVVALHPVEVLVFDLKISTLAAVIVTLPFFLYYAWPALKQRGFAGGDRRVLLLWAAALVFGLVGGSFFGYAIVAPTVISWLAADAIGANMVIAYRISSAGWLVFFTTAGVGLLATVPLSMVLFHHGGLVSYGVMRRRWREVTLAVLAVVAYATPQGVFMMFIIGIPAMFAYGLGLGLLWIATLGGRRRTGGRRQTAD